jgi:hypothetical protein
MHESDVPPPGDPSMRGTRVWGAIILAVILVFVTWYVLENRDPREIEPSGTRVQQKG